MAVDTKNLDFMPKEALDMIEQWLKEDGVQIDNEWLLVVYVMMKRTNRVEGDRENSEGFLICGKCDTPKQKMCYVETFQKKIKTTCPCLCEQEKLIAEEEARERNKFEDSMERWYSDLQIIKRGKGATFSVDNRNNASQSLICRNFVKEVAEQCEELKELYRLKDYGEIDAVEFEARKELNYARSDGLLLYGNVGAGKSFLAECVKNALIERRISALMTTVQILSSGMGQYKSQRTEILHKVSNVGLLILDDFGTERDTEAMQEVTLDILETRCNSRRPLVVTTNLTLEELQTPVRESGMSHRDYVHRCRTYDRLLSMCRTHIKFSGASQRRK